MLPWQSVVFATMGGLRGALSLILAQTVVTQQATREGHAPDVVYATMVLWTAGFVLMTLLINAPLLGPLIGLLGLDCSASRVKRQVRIAART